LIPTLNERSCFAQKQLLFFDVHLIYVRATKVFRIFFNKGILAPLQGLGFNFLTAKGEAFC